MIALPAVIGKSMALAVSRHNTKREMMLQVYRKATALIAQKRQWSAGESQTLYDGILRGRQAMVFMKNEGGKLNLVLFREGPDGRLDRRFYSKPLPVGMFKPDQGWSVVATEAGYMSWNTEVRKAIGS